VREKRIPKPRLTYDQLVHGAVAAIMAASGLTSTEQAKRLFRLDKIEHGYVMSSVNKKKGDRTPVHTFTEKPSDEGITMVLREANLTVESIIWRFFLLL
jgi:hypothetical protein